MASNGTGAGGAPHFDIPKECKAGVVVNEGPNFHVEVQMVPVPDPGMLTSSTSPKVSDLGIKPLLQHCS